MGARVLSWLPIEKELVIINDCSTDDSLQILENYPFKSNVILRSQDRNRGKGAAIRRGIEEATGVRRETASRYLQAAGVAVRPPGRWGHGPPKPAKEVSTDSGVSAKPAKETSTDPAWPPMPGRSRSYPPPNRSRTTLKAPKKRWNWP